MEKGSEVEEIVFARDLDGRTEEALWFRYGDTVRILKEDQEITVGPDAWMQVLAELEADGFVEIWPNDERKLAAERVRVVELIRSAFRGVELGEGTGLREADALDGYAGMTELAACRSLDEKHDWSSIPVADLDRYSCSLSFFNADGMRFHLPAFLVADLERRSFNAFPLFHLTDNVPYALSRFDTLSSAQREAVRSYLNLCLSDQHQEFMHPNIEAVLRDYWAAK